DAFAFEHAIGATGIADVFADSLFRTQLAMRDEAMRIQLSPFPRVAARVPQTQSAFLSASSIVGKSFGSFCRSASSVAMHRQFAVNWQRENFFHRGFGVRQLGQIEINFRYGRLLMIRHGIMNTSADSFTLQMLR